ncbi:hypothetical protein ACWIUD_11820 [Helicobacter sp. 23-1044]
MKKIMAVLVLFGISLSVNAASFEDNLTKLIEKQTQTQVKIVSKSDLKSSKDLKFVVIQLDGSKQQIPLFATKNGDMIIGLSNIFLTNIKGDEDIISKKVAEVEAHNESAQSIVVGELIKQLKPEQFITLKSKAKNAPTTFIIADPNCGYCKEEFRKIDERLKTQNVNMVMVGILGEDSLKKAAWVVSKVKSADTERTKLNALKEVFSNNFKAPKNIDTTAVKGTSEFLFKSGAIRGVPYIYEAK